DPRVSTKVFICVRQCLIHGYYQMRLTMLRTAPRLPFMVHGAGTMEERNVECDVLVVGTGASGMSVAVTAASQGLNVLVVEKEPRYGGTTARSGGWLWIPGTRLATEQGIEEPAGAARTYMQHEATTHFDA